MKTFGIEKKLAAMVKISRIIIQGKPEIISCFMDRAKALRKGSMYSADCQEKNIGQGYEYVFKLAKPEKSALGTRLSLRAFWAKRHYI